MSLFLLLGVSKLHNEGRIEVNIGNRHKCNYNAEHNISSQARDDMARMLKWTYLPQPWEAIFIYTSYAQRTVKLLWELPAVM